MRRVAQAGKGQTTVPKSVRDALGLGHGDRIAFSIDENRRVSVERDEADEADPVIESFLAFLAKDMRDHPGRSIAEIPDALRARIHRLTGADPADALQRYTLQTAVIGARLLGWPEQEL